jgi:hypothetical protein
MPSDHALPLSPAKKDDADFDAAVARFQQFLRANNYSGEILSVMPEDVLMTGRRFIYVRVPIPAINESTVCRMNESTYCNIWFPKSVEEVPQGIWPHDGTLKLSAKDKSSSPAGRPITLGVLWLLLKFWHRKNQRLKDFLFSHSGLITLVR